MLKGWKTLLFNSAIAIAAVAQAANWVEIVPAQYVPAVVAVVGFINVALRSITDTPMFKSEPVVMKK